MAALVLKNFVRDHWLHDTPSPEDVSISDAEKVEIKRILCSGLGDPVSRIRTAIAMCIASIAHWEWPRQWPELIPELVRCLDLQPPGEGSQAAPELPIVNGAMRCLEMFATGENLSDEHLPYLLPTLMPKLFEIFTNQGRYGTGLKRRAVAILYSLIEWMVIMQSADVATGDTSEASLITHLAAYLPHWLGAFASILSAPVPATVAEVAAALHQSPLEMFSLKIQAMKVLVALINGFASYTAPHLPNLLVLLWKNLISALPLYVQGAVLDDVFADDLSGCGSGGIDEGDSEGFELFVLSLLEVLIAVAHARKLRGLLRNPEVLPALVEQAVGFAAMARRLEGLWDTDPEAFIEHEAAEMTSFTVRSVAVDLLSELCRAFPAATTVGHVDKPTAAFAPAFAAAAAKWLERANGLRAAGNRDWWKLRETVVLAAGVAGVDGLSTAFAVEEFVRAVVVSDATASDTPPPLRARALWAASQFSEIFGQDMATAVIDAAVAALATGAAVPLRLEACRAMIALYDKVPSTVVAPHARELLSGIVALLRSTHDDTLASVALEALRAAVKLSPAATLECAGPLINELVQLWRQYADDAWLVEPLMDVFAEMARMPLVQPALLPNLGPLIKSLIGAAVAAGPTPPASAPASGVVQNAVDLLAMIVRTSPAMSAELLSDYFVPLTQLSLNTINHAVLQAAAECLTAFIAIGGDALFEWRVGGNGPTAAEVVLQVIARLLHTSVPDSAALTVGGLVSKLIAKHMARLANAGVLTEILRAAAVRLATAKMKVFIQSLLYIFVRFFVASENLSDILTFLASFEVRVPAKVAAGTPPEAIPPPTPMRALEFIITLWTKEHENFHGALYVNTSIVGLARLFTVAHPALSSLTVPGDLVVDAGSVAASTPPRMTRGRARRERANVDTYTLVPFHIKVVQILLKQIEIIFEDERETAKAAARRAAGIASDSEDDSEDDGLDDFSQNYRDLDEHTRLADHLSSFAPAEDYSMLLSDMLDEVEDEYDREDPDFVNDPLFNLDLKEFIAKFIRDFAATNRPALECIVSRLPPEDRNTAKKVLSLPAK